MRGMGTRFAVVALLLIVAALPPWPHASAAQSIAAAPAEAAAIAQFERAIAAYMALRRSLRNEVAGPVKNSTSSQVTNASDSLAGAIERARQHAHAGSIFSPQVSAVIKRRIADAVRSENLSIVLAGIDDDGIAGPAPKVHLRLPVSAQMATMPPSLLAVLPPLPKELEYRILGRYLVLRDVDASLILDYIPAAVPREPR